MPRKYAAESKPLSVGQLQFVANGVLKNQKKSYLPASDPAFFAIHGLVSQTQRTFARSALVRARPVAYKRPHFPSESGLQIPIRMSAGTTRAVNRLIMAS
jgi:hypothetical protein